MTKCNSYSDELDSLGLDGVSSGSNESDMENASCFGSVAVQTRKASEPIDFVSTRSKVMKCEKKSVENSKKAVKKIKEPMK